MGKDSKIEWTHHTFNPWIGCTKVSPACDNCYAEVWDKRFGGEHWGPKAPRRLTSEQNWHQPLKWNKEAEAAGERRRVFCASLADVFDNQAPEGAQERLWGLIKKTPWLDWLLLTKRPQNIERMLPSDWGKGYPNVWPGVTVENQDEANRRTPLLLRVSAAVHCLSCEPLLGPVNLNSSLGGTLWIGGQQGCGGMHHGIGTPECPHELHHHHDDRCKQGIAWVICGGESGPGSRPMHPDRARSLRDQCAAVGVAFHFKQWGAWIPWEEEQIPNLVSQHGKSMDGNCLPDLSDCEVLKQWNDDLLYAGEGWCVHQRVGKKAAGRLLDGREWDEVPMPAVSVAS
jgi:protein gp37